MKVNFSETFEEWKARVSIGSGSFNDQTFFITAEYGQSSENPIFDKAGKYVWEYQQEKISQLQEEIKLLKEKHESQHLNQWSNH